MELIRRTIRVGNSAGVLLPRRLLGAEVKITILKRATNYKRIALRLLLPYLEEIESACITNQNPLEIIAVSNSLKKILKNSQIKVTFVPKNLFLKDFEKNISLRKKILVSIPLINKNFFKGLI